MSITTSTFKIIDQQNECFKIEINNTLSNAEALLLRNEVTNCLNTHYDNIYIDVKNVTEIDLSGINEVINAHYILEKVSKKLIFVYKKNSPVETWVETTGLDKFVSTAILPAT